MLIGHLHLSSPSIVAPDLTTSFYCTLAVIGGQGYSQKDSCLSGNTLHRFVGLTSASDSSCLTELKNLLYIVSPPGAPNV